MHSRTHRRSPLLVLVAAMIIAAAGLAGAFTTDSAQAKFADDEFEYTGSGSSTKDLFNVRFFTNGEIGPLDVFPGQIAIRVKLTLDVTGTLNVPTDFHVEGPDTIVEGTSIPVSSTNVIKDGPAKEFKLTGTATLTIHADYDPDENGLECDDYGLDDTGDDVCRQIDVPQSVTLMEKDLVAPYATLNKLLEDQTTLLSLPICEIIGTLIGLPIISDLCDLNVDGVISARVEGRNPGLHADRDILLGGNAVAGSSAPIHWPSPNPVVDNVAVACGGNIGTDVSYRLRENSYDARVTEAGVGVKLILHFKNAAAALPDIELLDLTNVISILPDGPFNIDANAPDFQASIATLQAETTPPTIDNMATVPLTGTEGSPVNFQAAASDNCPGNLTYRWDFSDGGVAYGSSAHHTFNDNGTYSYQLTVTDLRGNSATSAANYIVINAIPVPNAGPDVGGPWGAAIALNGSAVDPGSVDQSTLHYEWNFGDGTPSATGSATVSHAYANPGTYTATLKVCDKDGACATDTAEVVVRKRNTSIGYLGAHTGIHDTAVNLSASLVDELGQSVNGRSVAFNLGTELAGSSNTSSSGVAAKTHTIAQGAGSPGVEAAFAGDSHYNAANASGSFTVAKKATSVVYTGALTGGPNKVITLSAKLTDAEGKPLAGRTINFVLGAQTASAVTDANGIAATTLKLTQKNGNYTLTSTFTPAGGDAANYLASSTSATFKLQAK